MKSLEHLDLPVLIIAYSRPVGVASLLQSLSLSGVNNIYLAIDGSKNFHDKINQEQIEAEINRYSKETNNKIKVLKRDINLGAAAGVITAIDWFFSQEKMGLILEDDLQISKDFCWFAKNALNKYSADEDVWMISGTQHFPNFNESKKTTWTNYPMIWGWAGWAQKWVVMRGALLEKKKIRISKLLDIRYLFWATGANRALSGKVDAWDTPLAFEFRNQKKLCLLPPVSLVSNVGNDEFATNTTLANRAMHNVLQNLDNNFRYSEKSNDALRKYNAILEKNIFNIKKKHIILPYYSFLFDNKRFPKSKRKLPLKKRLVIEIT